MYLKMIIMDGFKSYGKRVEISGFDSEFNAITGLNGTGKSNIVDAIKFALGLQNLKEIRVNNIQELIYKQGQTGVTKASVTLVFDNTNKSQSPPGYTSFNEITVARIVVLGGKNKYLLNGQNAQSNKVKDMFCSVQLNVNNPHFLVAQGQITKVLNMKPMEVLSMIEEASGTRMFETKKQEAERTLERKDQKLAQIDSYINKDIGPKLTKLKDERMDYLEFKKIERELEATTKIFTAWRYTNSKTRSQKGQEKAQELIEKINENVEKIRANKEEMAGIEAQVEKLREQMDSDSGGDLARVEKIVSDRTTKLTQAAGIQRQNVENIEDERKTIAELEKIVKDDEKILKGKSATMEKIEGTFQRLADQEEQDKRDLEKARKKFQALSAGFVVDDAGNEGTLQDKLMAAQKAIADAKIELETIKRKKPHCESELKLKQQEFSIMDAAFKKDNATKSKLENEIDTVRNKLSTCETLREEARAINADAAKLRRSRDTFEQRDGRLSFRYQDPEPGFSRKSVHGLVCRLIEVTDLQFSTAVEKTAGGRLFNVVVDTDVTSRKLLKNGKLERRTTIIPLNQISGHRLNPRVIQAAQRVAGADNVWPAISLIRYDQKLTPAMEYIFGSTLICRDIVTAKKVCYNPEVRARCVTLDGDTCDPSGTLTGGAQERTQPILPMLQELKSILHQLDGKDLRLAEIERELAKLSQGPDTNALKQKLDSLEDQLNNVVNRQHHALQLRTEIDALENEITGFTERLTDCMKIIKKEEATIKEIESKNEKADREKSIKDAEKDVQRLTKKSADSRKQVLERREEYDALKLELSELENVIKNNKDQIEVHKLKIQQLGEDAKVLEVKTAEAKAEVDKMKSELKAVKEVINKKNKDITKALQNRDKLSTDITALELEIKQTQKDHDKCMQEAKNCKALVAEMLKEHDWIAQEEQFFGKPTGAYDFSDLRPKDTEQRIANLVERKDKLGRTLNTKAMTLLAKTEEQYDDLMKKRSQIEIDKKNIIEVIEDLSEKKKEALKEAYMQVNKDFGSIFNTLLPGTVASLVPCDPNSVLHGLDIKIGFGGDTVNENLALSGGQKSLGALSFVLAMLRFKPAPIYILDEVDAALDSSHTENIGKMLKLHFRTSQFIVVSLKEGMFKNANVIFRTDLVDGVSTIKRTIGNPQRA